MCFYYFDLFDKKNLKKKKKGEQNITRRAYTKKKEKTRSVHI